MKLAVSPTPSRSSSVLSNSFKGSNSSLPPPSTYSASRMTAADKRYKYLRRLFMSNQMDFEFALWQMLHLFIAPQKVYRNFYYRKQTKSQFARDDPAFLTLVIVGLLVSSIGFAVILNLSYWQFWKLLFYTLIVDWIGVSVCMATVLWHLSNRYFKKDTCMDQDVEWGYAFDVHLNAFFPTMAILHGFQLIFLVFISQEWFVALLFGNTLWVIALGYYVYITFLGYSCLPILQRTHVLLYPLMLLVFVYVVSLAIRWNLSETFIYIYKFRIL